MWPEVIGEKLNCKVINTGKCGFGNHAIYHTTLNAIMNNKQIVLSKKDINKSSLL